MIIAAIIGMFKILSAIFIVLRYEAKGDVKINIITRNGWNAILINETINDLDLPLNKIIILHTVTNECNTKDECTAIIQSIQKLHLGSDFKFSDIGYNFIIGGDGNIYEGRGWYKQGAHTSGYNRGSVGIAFIGNFNAKLPNDIQIAAVFDLITRGMELNILANNYTIFGAAQLRNTSSPGDAFMKLIKTWAHASQD